MKKTDIAKIVQRNIDKFNRKFKKATAAQRRVLIARDALTQLEAEKYKAMKGDYVYAVPLASEAGLSSKAQLNTLLHNPSLKSSCKVCALGALLLSAVRHRNDCEIYQDGYTSETDFVREFSEKQRDLIEAAFEQWKEDRGWNNLLTQEQRLDSTKRLKLILKNIIRNKGKFVPTER